MRRLLMSPSRFSRLLLVAALLVTAEVYWPGLRGGWLFDDYPNIVDNHDVQPKTLSVATLVTAALSSPASELRRPLSSLSFALNYVAAGLDPYWMKLTNLGLHLINGFLVFVLTRKLIRVTNPDSHERRIGVVAALVAAGWMLLPINLTAVLYIVQRMESLANVFVLLGLIGYVTGRARMAEAPQDSSRGEWRWFVLCVVSLTVPTAMGLLAKETAVLLPLYALVIEWVLFAFRRVPAVGAGDSAKGAEPLDHRVVALFAAVLVIPMLAGLAWLVPGLLKPESWVTRDFTLHTRLLSEARIVLDYIHWTLLPTPEALSFYHDNFQISTSLVSPWTTLASILGIFGLIAMAVLLRKRLPLLSLGVLLYLGCHLLTGTILPLELIYEHRNYFASFGLVLALMPLLLSDRNEHSRWARFSLAGRVLAGGLIMLWAMETALTSVQWSSPLSLAAALASRAPDSPRAQYELGRTYIIYSDYDPNSPFTKLAYPPLEKAASLPGSSILPLQALIFMNSRMHLPLEKRWWDAMIEKLKSRKPGVQDESSLGALTQCIRIGQCDIPADDMLRAYAAALSHPNPSARLLAMYGDYAWNVLGDRELGLSMTREAIAAAPREPAYLVTLIKMEIVSGKFDEASSHIARLQILSIGGSLDALVKQLTAQLTSSEQQH